MELACSLTQAQAIRTLIGAQAICLWVRNEIDTTRVQHIVMLDAKMGQIVISFTGTFPTIVQVQAAFTNNTEITAIAG